MASGSAPRVFALEDCQFTLTEAAQHLRVSRSHLYELIAEEKIRPVKIGKRRIVQGGELRRYMDSLAAVPESPRAA